MFFATVVSGYENEKDLMICFLSVHVCEKNIFCLMIDDVVIQFNTTVKDDTEANKTANDTAETEKLDDTIEVVDNSTTENTSAISLDTSDQQNVSNTFVSSNLELAIRIRYLPNFWSIL